LLLSLLHRPTKSNHASKGRSVHDTATDTATYSNRNRSRNRNRERHCDCAYNCSGDRSGDRGGDCSGDRGGDCGGDCSGKSAAAPQVSGGTIWNKPRSRVLSRHISSNGLPELDLSMKYGDSKHVT
jgi:hypothetical protein